MNKQFYSHIVDTASLIAALNKLELTDEQKAHLLTLIDSHIHHAVLDVILSELSNEDKKVFLKHLAAGDHDNIWQHLNQKVDGIEEKIIKVTDTLKKELHEDIEATKSHK